VIDAFARIQTIDAADHVVEGAKAELCHVFAHFFGDEEKEIHHMLG